jgi:hypothetical protein
MGSCVSKGKHSKPAKSKGKGTTPRGSSVASLTQEPVSSRTVLTSTRTDTVLVQYRFRKDITAPGYGIVLREPTIRPYLPPVSTSTEDVVVEQPPPAGKPTLSIMMRISSSLTLF